MIYKQKKRYASNKYTAQLMNMKWAHLCDRHPSQNINTASTTWAPFLPPSVQLSYLPKDNCYPDL